jgi:diadenosine tetraphosphate (Ap4A) HIT family hydrolase
MAEDATGADRGQPVPDLSPEGEGAGGGCVFCHPEFQPPALVTTDLVRLVPDLYPLAQGHLLVISREHLPCYGAADTATLEALEDLSGRASRFIEDTYAVHPLAWENGVTGQSVYHAHLHLIPLALEGLVDVLASDPASIEIDGWEAVRERYRDHGAYHYAALRGRRWLLEANGVTNWEVRRLIAIGARLRLVDGRWTRHTTADDVAEVGRRWRQWTGAVSPASD